MKTELKKLPGSRIGLKLSLLWEEFEVFIEQALTEGAQEVTLPGYRQGKAPRQLVRQQLGESWLYQQAARKAVEKIYSQLVEEKHWEVITKPEVSLTRLTPAQPVEFEVVFTVVPELELPANYQDYLRKLKKQKSPVQVQEQEIESSLLWLQRSRGQFQEVNRQLKEGDWPTIDLVIKADGQIVESGQQSDFRFLFKKGSLLPGFFEQLEGHQKGERLSFALSVPQDYWRQELAGKLVEIEVWIKKVEQEILPELNDEFARGLGRFNSLAELRESLATGLKQELEEKERQKFRLALLDQLTQLVRLELPEVLVEREKQIMLEEVKASVADSGLSWQDYLAQLKRTESELKNEFALEAKKRLSYALILKKVAEKEGVEPTREEVEAEANKFLSQFKSVKQAETSIDVYKLIAYTREKLRNEKVLQLLEQVASA